MTKTKLFQTDPNEKRDEDTGPKLDDLGFWDKLVALVASVIEEDRNSYAPVLSQFPAELNIGQVKCPIDILVTSLQNTSNIFMVTN